MAHEQSDESIIAAYEWRPGECFRCAATDVPTARVGAILDGETDVRACKTCLLTMEGDRRRDAARKGVPYEPGHGGQPQ